MPSSALPKKSRVEKQFDIYHQLLENPFKPKGPHNRMNKDQMKGQKTLEEQVLELEDLDNH